MKNYLRNLKKKIGDKASPHYDYGDSILKLSVHNLLTYYSYARAVKPPRKIFEGTRKLKNSKSGKTALLLGNGHSLSMLNTSIIPKYIDDIFVVNDFFKLEVSKYIKPTYYVLSDPLDFQSKKNKKQVHSGLHKYITDNECILILPHTANLQEYDQIIFNDLELRIGNKINPLRPRRYTSVTLYKALAMAEWFGYEKIFILGLDNTELIGYVGDHENRIFSKAQRYAPMIDSYQSESNVQEMNMFVSGMAGRMKSYSRLFSDLKKFNTSHIVNLNENSIVDVFHKVQNHPLVSLQ